MTYLLITRNPIDGYGYTGPFTDRDDAERYAEARPEEFDEYIIERLHMPEAIIDPHEVTVTLSNDNLSFVGECVTCGVLTPSVTADPDNVPRDWDEQDREFRRALRSPEGHPGAYA